MIRIFLPLVLSLALSACLTQPPAPTVDRTPVAEARAEPVAKAVPTAVVESAPGKTHTVKRGETLYRIALENGQDYRDVAAWNNIANPASIKEGQVLRVSPPGAVDSGPVVAKPVAVAPQVESRALDSKPAQSSDGVKREPKVGKEPYSDEAYARLNKAAGPAPTPEARTPVEPKPEVKPEIKPEAPTTPLGPDEVAWAWPTSGKVLTGFGQSGSKGIDIVGKAGDPVLAASDGKVVYAGAGLPGYGELVIIKHNATYLSAYGHNRKILVKEGQAVTRGQKIAEMGNTGTDTVKLHFEIRKQGNPVDPAPMLPKR